MKTKTKKSVPNKVHVKKGDKVVVISGKDKGKVGECREGESQGNECGEDAGGEEGGEEEIGEGGDDGEVY